MVGIGAWCLPSRQHPWHTASELRYFGSVCFEAMFFGQCTVVRLLHNVETKHNFRSSPIHAITAAALIGYDAVLVAMAGTIIEGHSWFRMARPGSNVEAAV